MSRHPISKRRMLVGTRWTPPNHREIFEPEPFGSIRVTREWPAAVETAAFQPALPHPFMVSTKGTTREAGLERSPALRWLRREVGPRVPCDTRGTLPRVPEPEGSDSYLTPGRG